MTRRVVSFSGSTGNRLAASEYMEAVASQMARPAVLFMHGGGQTRHSWKGAAQRIARLGLRAITLDARGHGESEWAEDGNYLPYAFRDDLRCVAQELCTDHGGHAPIIVGASMGGISAMLAQDGGNPATGKPWFSAIVLVDITPRMERSGVDRIMGFMAQNVDKGFASVEEAADVIAEYLPNRTRPKSSEGLRKNLRLRDDGRWYWHWDPAFVNGYRNIESDPAERQAALLAAASTIDVPTLLVRGARSELVSEEAVEEFRQLVPHARFVDVSDAGHMVAGDKNDVFADAVIQFLDDEVLKMGSSRSTKNG